MRRTARSPLLLAAAGLACLLALAGPAAGRGFDRPTISYVLDPPVPTGTNGWYRSYPTVRWTVANAVSKSGCDDVSFTTDGMDDATCSATNADGTDSVTATARVDTTAPWPWWSLSPAAPDGLNGWYLTDPTTTLSATDATSGMAGVRYAVDAGTEQNYTGPFQLCGASACGRRTLSVSATDIAGNVQTPLTATIKIDLDSPTSWATIAPAPVNGAYDAPVVSLFGDDGPNGSGIGHFEVSIDGDPFSDRGSVLSGFTPGNHFVRFRAVDNAGRVELTTNLLAFRVRGPLPSGVVLTSSPASLGGGAYDVTATLTNNSAVLLTNATLRLDLVSGSSLTVDVTTPVPAPDLASGDSFSYTWHVTGATACDPTNAYDIGAAYTDPAATTKTVHGNLPGPACGSKSGKVTRDFGATPVPDAEVGLCLLPAGTPCAWATTDADGRYTIAGLPPGDYRVGAWGLPPLVPFILGSEHIAAGQQITDEDLDLQPLQPLPDGTAVGGAGLHDTDGGLVRLNREGSVQISRTACENGSATLALEQNGVAFFGPVPMPELPPGTYTAVIPAQANVEFFRVTIHIDCPLGPDVDSTFDAVYIDPSGVVSNALGGTIAGAKVTLLRADSPHGPFVAVPDGSSVMSLLNRTNPDVTDGAGHFAWDVRAGYYKVRAEKAGCTTRESAVLQIPPAVTDLDLVLICPGDLEQLVAGTHVAEPGLAADLRNRAHTATTRLVQNRPQGCDALDAFASQTVFAAGQDTPGIGIEAARTLVAEAYDLETAFGCPGRAAGPAEQADLDLLGSIAGQAVESTLARDLRTAARQISTAVTGNRTADACDKAAALLARIKGQTGKKLTANQAAVLGGAGARLAATLGC